MGGTGGTLRGVLKQGEVPPAATLLTQASSPPLADAIRLINKNSNNVMARQMLLTIAAEKKGAPGSVEKGAAAITEWLAGKGLVFPELVIENGAGRLGWSASARSTWVSCYWRHGTAR